jgi:hypothetical protein
MTSHRSVKRIQVDSGSRTIDNFSKNPLVCDTPLQQLLGFVMAAIPFQVFYRIDGICEVSERIKSELSATPICSTILLPTREHTYHSSKHHHPIQSLSPKYSVYQIMNLKEVSFSLPPEH